MMCKFDVFVNHKRAGSFWAIDEQDAIAQFKRWNGFRPEWRITARESIQDFNDIL